MENKKNLLTNFLNFKYFIVKILRYFGNYYQCQLLMNQLCRATCVFWCRNQKIFKQLKFLYEGDLKEILEIFKDNSIYASYNLKDDDLLVVIPHKIPNNLRKHVGHQLINKQISSIKYAEFNINCYSMPSCAFLLEFLSKNTSLIGLLILTLQKPEHPKNVDPYYYKFYELFKSHLQELLSSGKVLNYKIISASKM
ncbi:unnamed protein product [Moneuplotes crassus]|uniref:Uncharacterized protein n=1 Tax=Euplotes crassus TaxID=5936 RepID=A0AAD1XYI7_EUPCR|nr:unnamed protein product [Moneuplotes crassus]